MQRAENMQILPQWPKMTTNKHKSQRIIALINKAATVAGNDTKLAELIGEARGRMSSWRAGKRACPIEAQILMAKIAGENPIDVMREAIIERNDQSERGKKIEDAFWATS